MLYRPFGGTGWQVSAIGQGTWNISNQWGPMDDAVAQAIVRTAFDNGINLFDAAESYGIPNGLSEIRLGKALKGVRDKVYIVTKIGYWGSRTGQSVPKTTVDMIRLCGHACLGRLRTEWIDVLLCHEANITDPSLYIQGFEALREEGCIREYGISTDTLAVLKNFQDKSGGRCRVAEVAYSLLNRAAEAEFLPYCREQGIAVLVRGPLAMGLLAGKYDAQSVFTDSVRQGWNTGQPGRAAFEENIRKLDGIRAAVGSGRNLATTALRFVISHPCQPVAIPGATSVTQALQNATAGQSLLPADEYESLTSG